MKCRETRSTTLVSGRGLAGSCAALTDAGIGNGIHYPLPLHLQPACAALGYRPGDFPASERVAETTLSLPMHPHLTDAEIETVAAAVRGAL